MSLKKALDHRPMPEITKPQHEAMSHTDPWIIDRAVVEKTRATRLTGTVPTGMQRLDAAVVARSTPGVCSVRDDLRAAA